MEDYEYKTGSKQDELFYNVDADHAQQQNHKIKGRQQTRIDNDTTHRLSDFADPEKDMIQGVQQTIKWDDLQGDLKAMDINGNFDGYARFKEEVFDSKNQIAKGLILESTSLENEHLMTKTFGSSLIKDDVILHASISIDKGSTLSDVKITLDNQVSSYGDNDSECTSHSNEPLLSTERDNIDEINDADKTQEAGWDNQVNYSGDIDSELTSRPLSLNGGDNIDEIGDTDIIPDWGLRNQLRSSSDNNLQFTSQMNQPSSENDGDNINDMSEKEATVINNLEENEKRNISNSTPSSTKSTPKDFIPQDSIYNFILGLTSSPSIIHNNPTTIIQNISQNTQRTSTKIYDIQRQSNNNSPQISSKSSSDLQVPNLVNLKKQLRKSSLVHESQLAFDFDSEHVKNMYALSEWTSDITDVLGQKSINSTGDSCLGGIDERNFSLDSLKL
eukprot:TCONS_00072609-protein